jgi:hypothetical protein
MAQHDAVADAGLRRCPAAVDTGQVEALAFGAGGERRADVVLAQWPPWWRQQDTQGVMDVGVHVRGTAAAPVLMASMNIPQLLLSVLQKVLGRLSPPVTSVL